MFESTLVPLDYGKLIKLFTTSNNYVLVTNVLQALRWRITRSHNSYERRSVVVAFATHDIIGTHQRNIMLAQYLLIKAHPKIQEHTLKLLNALASDYSGRTYLTQSSQLIKYLADIVKREVPLHCTHTHTSRVTPSGARTPSAPSRSSRSAARPSSG